MNNTEAATNIFVQNADKFFVNHLSVFHHITVYLELRDSDQVEVLSRRVEQCEKNVATEVSPQN